jgi:hypothetical protein
VLNKKVQLSLISMTWRNITCAVAVLLFSGALWILAQAPGNQDAPPRPKAQFFAGIVTDVSREHVTVSRSLVGRPRENRTFLITRQTKMSRPVRIRSRVTVRYRSLPEGDVALEIQVRSQTRPLRPS